MGRGQRGDEKGEVSLRATWDQGRQGRITPEEGFQVSKGEQRGVSGEWQGEQRMGNCAITCAICCICIYNNCLNVECNNNLYCV
jgi:hypothetical protein